MRNLSELPGDVRERISRNRADTHMLLLDWAGTLENQAKTNRAWTDRTAHARQGLKAKVVQMGNKFTISLGHGVEYGIWLELANAGDYAIVGPTMDVNEEGIKRSVRELWSD